MQTIKRYPNRKLYHTEQKKYITLEGIAELIRQGEEVQVVDYNTGEDLTAVTLSQIIFEQEKKRGGFLPQSVLTGLIRSGGETVHTMRKTLESSLGIAQDVGEEIDRRVHALIDSGELDAAEGERLLEKLLAVGKKLPPVVQPIESQLRRALAKRGIPTREELAQLTNYIDELAKRLDNLEKEPTSETDATSE